MYRMLSNGVRCHNTSQVPYFVIAVTIQAKYSTVYCLIGFAVTVQAVYRIISYGDCVELFVLSYCLFCCLIYYAFCSLIFYVSHCLTYCLSHCLTSYVLCCLICCVLCCDSVLSAVCCAVLPTICSAVLWTVCLLCLLIFLFLSCCILPWMSVGVIIVLHLSSVCETLCTRNYHIQFTHNYLTACKYIVF